MDPSLQNIKCPDCNGPMIPRTNKGTREKFWGCKAYPNCKGTRDSLGRSKVDREYEKLNHSKDTNLSEEDVPLDLDYE